MKILTVLTLPCISAFMIGNTQVLKQSSTPYMTGLVASTFSPIQQQQEPSIKSTPKAMIVISRPEIHWTVPGTKLGWNDQDGNWFDEDGPRNGPPVNYWRQSLDQSEYQRDMDAITSILHDHGHHDGNEEDDWLHDIVTELQSQRSTRTPALNRKLLGSWAPIVVNGKCVARFVNSTHSNYDYNYDDNYDQIRIPFQLHIGRKHGRRLAPPNHYGTFDRRLDPKEDLFIHTSTSSSSSSASSIKGLTFGFQVTVTVQEDNQSRMMGMMNMNIMTMDMNGNTHHRVPLYQGGIVYITDYIMIQCTREGVYDVWLRADKSYLGLV